jgi:hypothetical protein
MSKADALLVGHHNHGPAAELHTYKQRLTTRAHVHVVLYNIRMPPYAWRACSGRGYQQ